VTTQVILVLTANDRLKQRFDGMLAVSLVLAATLHVLLSSFLCTVLVMANFTRGLVGLFTFALVLATVTVLLSYVLTPLAHIVLIRREPERWGGQGARLAIVVSALAAVYSVFAVAGPQTSKILLGVLLFAAGAPLYLWSTHRRAEPESR